MKRMTASQYRHARETLGWTHEHIGAVLGVDLRTSYRYSAGDVEIPEPSARLVRLLVRVRLTMSKRKFGELVEELH
jgi:hypothetical protein